jgi:DNA replication protein DnaC
MNSIEQKMHLLKLGRMRTIYPDWLVRAAEVGMDYAEFLEQLLSEEVLARQENQLKKRLKSAGFPFDATVEQFDFSRHPELKRSVLLRFFDSSFVEKKQNLLLLGASGLGKTHLAISCGVKMAQLGYTVKFITAQKLANAVLLTRNRAELERILQPLLKCQLLILDELGYLPLEERVGPVLFELVSGRYQKGATIITSNKALAQWNELLVGEDNALIVALLDRLLHNGEAFYLRGTSYRTLGKERDLPKLKKEEPPADNSQSGQVA